MASNAVTMAKNTVDWKKYMFMAMGVFLFVLVQYSPPGRPQWIRWVRPFP